MKHLSFLIILIMLLGCSGQESAEIVANDPHSCPVAEPEWVTPPDDTAVSSAPVASDYYINEDRTILASAWFFEEYALVVGERGNKMGWFRPAGETLEISGQRLDAEASPMEASVPCCYPTQFQATGLMFPTAGCWQVDAQAADKALSFVVWVGEG